MDEELLYSPDPSRFMDKFVGPKGSTNPRIYIVGEAPGQEEHDSGIPFVGPAGKTLDRILDAAGIDISTVRWWNAIPYRPFEISQWKKVKNRTPTDDEINFYKVFLLADIEKTKPEIIVAAGRTAMLALGIEESTQRKARESTYHYNEIPVFCTWHPSYVNYRSETTRTFDECVDDFKRAVNSKKRQIQELDSKIIDILDYDEIEDELWEFDTLVLDYEASGVKPYNKDFHLAGIALKGLGSSKSYYIYMHDFWRTKNEIEIPEDILKRIGALLSAKRVIVWNMQYECAVTLSIFDRYLKNVTDLLLWSRALGTSSGKSNRLKDVAQRRLNIQRWASEVDTWVEQTTTLFKKCAVTPKGNARHEMIFISEGDAKLNLEPAKTFEDVLIYILAKFNIVEFSELNEPNKAKKLTQRDIDVFNAFDGLNQIANKYYKGEKLEAFCQKFFKLLRNRTEAKDSEIRYTDIPIEIIGTYAIYDIYYTDALYFNFKEEIEKSGLERTIEIYNSHGNLAFEIESAGIGWDNDKAEELDRQYKKAAVETLRQLILVPKMLDILEINKTQDILKIQTTNNLDDLTEFFNPGSSHATTRDRLSNLLITGRVKFTRMLYEIFKDFSPRPEAERYKNFPVLYPIIDQLLAIKNPLERIEMMDDFVNNAQAITKKIIEHPENDPDVWRDKKKNKIEVPEREIWLKFSTWSLEKTDSAHLSELFDSFESILGVDVDNKSTWIPEFEQLILFKKYKKIIKNWTSYVWGKNGRGHISAIDLQDIETLKNTREPGHKEKRPNEKIWIKETEVGVLTAKTRRWQCGDHTLPSGSELMDTRISRFPDGVIIHYDYSQMELRIAAHLAQDHNLLDKFEAGADIHGFIATKVWKKPERDISKDERRFSKSGTFAILYGDTPPGFAVKFMHGDVPAAEALFNNFYEGFPDMKTWIKKQHRLSLDTGIIKTYLNDSLDIEMPYQAIQISDSDKDLLAEDVYTRKVVLSDNWKEDRYLRGQIAKAFRNSQNWPIQLLSSVLAGLGINYMNQYLREQQMTSRVVLFTHDSGDIDAQIADVPKIVEMIPETSVNRIREEFGISVKTDVEICITGRKGVEISRFSIKDGVIGGNFKANKQYLQEVVDKLEKHNVRCCYEIEESETEKSSVKDLFQQKKAYSLDIGKPKEIVKGIIAIDFANAERIQIK